MERDVRSPAIAVLVPLLRISLDLCDFDCAALTSATFGSSMLVTRLYDFDSFTC